MSDQDAASRPAGPGGDDEFDEQKYLRAFADVAAAVQAGEYASAEEHYLRYGRRENRLEWRDYRHAWPVADSASFPDFGVDAAFCSGSGQYLIFGWINDEQHKLRSIGLALDATLLGETSEFARCRRQDAESKVGAVGRLLGFWTLIRVGGGAPVADTKLVLMTEADQRLIDLPLQKVTEARIRELALEYFATTGYFGSQQVEFSLQLDGGLGRSLIALNLELSARMVSGHYSKRFGPQRPRYEGSIVVCLYGKPEYVFLQAAFFSVGVAWPDYEFVFVSNSPELADILLKEAAIAARIYGLTITLVILTGNAGLGAANNVGVAHARSDRILIVNPDVFPREREWAARHTALVQAAPAAQTRLFGVPLYYDDGSLMHGGLYFELDEGLSVRPDGIARCDMVRVEHSGKGLPADAPGLRASRPVPAVTGAFMSIDREWFEQLGGFSPEYIFGHYEDADLCLNSLQRDQPAWLHDLPFLHLDGKGSNRTLAHEGAAQVNRWHFTKLWGEVIQTDLLGQAPARFDRIGRA